MNVQSIIFCIHYHSSVWHNIYLETKKNISLLNAVSFVGIAFALWETHPLPVNIIDIVITRYLCDPDQLISARLEARLGTRPWLVGCPKWMQQN